VTVYVPADPEHESAEVPEVPSVTLVGFKVQVSPVAGETAEDRFTGPVNPFTAVTVMVEVPLEPATNATVVGLAATVKSFTE
jgi:hypothetical protein